MADVGAPFRIKGETGEWEVVVGLEVHAQITATASKLFSGAATAFGAEHAGLADRCGDAGDAASSEPRMHSPGGAYRHGARSEDQPLEPLRP